MGELYYEAFRYLQGQQPTPLAIAGITGVKATDRYLLFNPAGFPRSSTDGIATGSVVFYLPEGRATAVVYSQAGRIRRCDPTKTGCRPTS
mgnify:CR=1 FL=1